MTQPAWDKGFNEVVVHGRDEVSLVASCRDLYLSYYDGPITAARLKPCFSASRALRARYPDGYVAFNIIGAHTPTSMDRSAREAIDDLARANRGFPMLCDATIIEADGFVAAAARAVLTGMQALSGSRYPRAVFRDVDKAASWAATFLRPTSAGPVPAAAIVKLVGELRGRRA